MKAGAAVRSATTPNRFIVLHPRSAMTSRREPKTYVAKTIRSPVGALRLIASNDGLAAILWENDNPRRVRIRAGDGPR